MYITIIVNETLTYIRYITGECFRNHVPLSCTWTVSLTEDKKYIWLSHSWPHRCEKLIFLPLYNRNRLVTQDTMQLCSLYEGRERERERVREKKNNGIFWFIRNDGRAFSHLHCIGNCYWVDDINKRGHCGENDETLWCVYIKNE